MPKMRTGRESIACDQTTLNQERARKDTLAGPTHLAVRAVDEVIRSNDQVSLRFAGCEINHNGEAGFSAFCRGRRGAGQ